MTTRLEQLLRLKWTARGIVGSKDGAFIEHKQALSAARLDAEDAYRRGLKDGIMAANAGRAVYWFALAKVACSRKRTRWLSSAKSSMAMFIEETDEAFHGARGIARVEIRQRLEKLKEGTTP